jgi:hypothetical protein
MGLGSLFKLPRYNVFDYQPRFFDPEIERRRVLLNDLRKAQGKTEIDFDGKECKPGQSIKGSFRPKMPRKAFSSRSSNIRVLIYVFALSFLAYLIFVADLSNLVRLFSN